MAETWHPMEATHAGHKIGVIVVSVASASLSSLLACHLCKPPDRDHFWSERSILWGYRYKSFVAGLLLSIGLLEVLPFIQDAYFHLFNKAGVIVLFPLANMSVCFGFLVAWSIYTVTRCSYWRQTPCYSDPRQNARNKVRGGDIELQVRDKDTPGSNKVPDVSSSEEDILYDSGEVWTPLMQNGTEGSVSESSHAVVTPTTLIGPRKKMQDEETGEDDDCDESDSAVTRLLSDPSIEASKADQMAQQEEEAASVDFYQCYLHIAVLFCLIGAFTQPFSIWILGFGLSCYVTLATHQLCAYLINRFNLFLLFGFSFCFATISSASGMSVGLFLVAAVGQVSWHVAACLVWAFAAGCQLFASFLLTANVINNRLRPLHVVICMTSASALIAIIKFFN